MFATLNCFAILLLSLDLVAALAVHSTPFVILPDGNSLTSRFSPMTDNGESRDGHITPRVIAAIVVVLFIFIAFVLALCCLKRWRRAAHQARRTSPPLPANVYRTGIIQTYSHNMHHAKAPSSIISGSELESLDNSPGTIVLPAEAHLRPGTTASTLNTTRL